MANKIQIPQTRSQLEELRAKLVRAGSPGFEKHVEYIDTLLADVDKGLAVCAEEEK